MPTRVHSDRHALMLAPDTYIERSPASGLSTLKFPGGAILLSDSAAEILELCDGRNTTRAILARLRARGLAGQISHSRAFIDAACKRGWVLEQHLLRTARMPVKDTARVHSRARLAIEEFS